MTDYQLIIKVRNARLWRAIKSKGYASVARFCADNGLPQQLVSGFLTMRISPLRVGGDWTKPAFDVSSALQIEPEELWPEHMRRKLERNGWIVEVDNPAEIAAPEDNSLLKAAENKGTVLVALAELPDRTQQILISRYWDNATLAEAGETLGISQARAQQIETKGLRTMRRVIEKKEAQADIRRFMANKANP